MEEYKFIKDDIPKRGFIDKKTILECVSQERIFELIFGFEPQEFQYVTSPFRIDGNPGCWFEYTFDGKLLLKDFGNSKKTHFDCFDAIQWYFKLPNFYLTLQFVYDNLVKGTIIEQSFQRTEFTRKDKKEVKLLVECRDFTRQDASFWSSYMITKANMIEDKVFSVERFYALNTKKGNISHVCRELAFAFTDFQDGRKKIYFPYQEGSKRFISTCNRNDIGGVNSLLYCGEQLIITKSYKDYRVLVNNGKNAIWLQNEGMVPNFDILNPIIKRFKKVIVWFDNDRAGIEAAKKISCLINQYTPGKSQPLWLPEALHEEGITDPSDLLQKQGQESLILFLKKFT